MNCDCTRRRFLGGTIGGFFAFAMKSRFDWLFAQDAAGKAKRIVVLWMGGGPSQLDTFDPKPGMETGGEFRAIDTASREIRISETLPNVAKRMDRLSVIRNLNSKEGEHLRATYLLHTGHEFVESFQRPSMGAVVSYETAPVKFPKYVSIGSAGFGPAFLGAHHAPFVIENANEALQMLRKIQTRSSRLKLMRDLGSEFDGEHAGPLVDQRNALVEKIEQLVDTPFVKALDVNQESQGVRDRYGRGGFATNCLLARRMLEAGVRFVEVDMGGWDTHQNNFAAVRNLCRNLDQPWAALMDDLVTTGLYDETVVVWMGEFGRTPVINRDNGRDHYPQSTPVVIGGGGIAGGRVVGSTNATGTQIVGDRVGVGDLFATLYTAFGVSPAKKLKNDFGAPVAIAEDGKAIEALF